jgi:hypothetical protein
MGFDKSKPFGTQLGTPLEGFNIQNEKWYNNAGDEYKLSDDGKDKVLVAKAPKVKASTTEDDLSKDMKG